MIKTPVACQPDYTIYYEYWEQKIWTHTDVYKWTPRVAKEFTRGSGSSFPTTRIEGIMTFTGYHS